MKNSQTKNNKADTKLSYMHTDLACECVPDSDDLGETLVRDFTVCGHSASEMLVRDEKGEAATGRKCGRYLTLFCPSLSHTSELCPENITDALSALLKDIIKTAGFEINGKSSVLIAGLGNRFITSDAIGPKTTDKILATAHLNRENKKFSAIGAPSVSIISPGVASQTGIDAFCIIKSAAESANADFIIAIDALASRNTERLCSTIQISDSGIHPGSGIGNHRTPITKETIGTPVIAIGIPTVISSATLIYDAFMNLNADELTPIMEELLEKNDGFFVSPGDSDTICEIASNILAGAIEQTLLEKLYK